MLRPMSSKTECKVLLALVTAAFVAFGWNPVADRFTWFLENVPTLIVAPILIATYKRFPLTRLAYRLIAVHTVILMIGGHWTYAEVPIGNWARDTFHLARNHYDRLGHLAQGFIPVIIMRELLVRQWTVKRGVLLNIVCVLMALGVSAFYELFEWWTAVSTGTAATAFLGTQGDVWDTQWDMFCALIGATLALLIFSSLHDRELVGLEKETAKL